MEDRALDGKPDQGNVKEPIQQHGNPVAGVASAGALD
jgi:hypothetical protein